MDRNFFITHNLLDMKKLTNHFSDAGRFVNQTAADVERSKPEPATAKTARPGTAKTATAPTATAKKK